MILELADNIDRFSARHRDVDLGAQHRHRSDAASRAAIGPPSSLERTAFWIAALTQIALRIAYTFTHRADADEPQHLHVVWGWTQGLVQYRDTFDNHTPLFHLAMAPLVGLVGARSDLVVYARWLMLPLVAASLWATYRIGSSLWSPTVGRWGTLLAGFVPTFLLTTTEFRTDVLWMTCWLFALVALFVGPFTPRRAIVSGLFVGSGMATSLKTIPLLLALGLAVAVTVAVVPRARRPALPWRSLAWLVGGALIVPLAMIAIFWRLHALGSLIYCTVWHNLVPHVGLWATQPGRAALFPVAFVGLLTASAALVRIGPARASGRQTCLFLTTAFYLAILESFWPLITKQDFLPSTPLVALLIVAGFNGLLDKVAHHVGTLAIARVRFFALASMCAIDLVAVCHLQLPWRASNQAEERILEATLRTTRPGEPIMDVQGETIFRPRPFYFLFEDLTATRLALGLLKDDIAADISRTRTHFAVNDSEYFPPACRTFLNAHFTSAGGLRVLGTRLAPETPSTGADLAFDVCYTERFAVLARGVRAAGLLDGRRYDGPALLRAGSHRYRPAPGERDLMVVWASALERNILEIPHGGPHP